MRYTAFLWINSPCTKKGHDHALDELDVRVDCGCCAETEVGESDDLAEARDAVRSAAARHDNEGGNVVDTESNEAVWSL